jgi:hypothetical protein
MPERRGAVTDASALWPRIADGPYAALAGAGAEGNRP